MQGKKHLLIVFALVAFGILVLVFNYPKNPTSFRIPFLGSSGTTVPQELQFGSGVTATQSGYEVAKKLALSKAAVISSPNDTLYTLRGKFIQKPAIQDDVLKGNFVIDGDSSSTPIGLHFSIPEAFFLYGEPKGKEIAFTPVKVTEVEKKLEAKTPYEVTFVNTVGSPIAGMKEQAVQLDAILTTEIIPKDPKVIILIRSIRPI